MPYNKRDKITTKFKLWGTKICIWSFLNKQSWKPGSSTWVNKCQKPNFPSKQKKILYISSSSTVNWLRVSKKGIIVKIFPWRANLTQHWVIPAWELSTATLCATQKKAIRISWWDKPHGRFLFWRFTSVIEWWHIVHTTLKSMRKVNLVQKWVLPTSQLCTTTW